MLSGVNIEATVELARALTIPVIASGGMATSMMLKRSVKSIRPGI